MFLSNRVAEILDTNDVSQWKHLSGVQNPEDIGARETTLELKGSELLTGLAWLRKPEKEWPEQAKHVFASEKENIPASAFIAKA